ncbi:MAG: DMT family transporter [Sphingopyxis sp.]|nr:DMT family transporter [Sphingopyxis sp.]
MSASSLRMTAHDWGLIAILAIVWGGAFFLIELGLTGFGPLTLVALRMLLAIPLMLLALKWLGHALPRDARSWWQLTILGFFNVAMPMALFFWAQTRIDSGLASILNATVPLWGVLIAHVFTRDERATPLKLAGVVLGFGGIIVMVGPDAVSGMGQDVIAQLACLFAAASFAGAAVYARRLGATIVPMAAATGQIVTAAALIAPLALVVEPPWAAPVPNLTAIAAMLTLALVGTSFAYFIFFRLIDRAGASNALLIALVMPPVAILLGVAVLGEVLTGGQIAGMALIALGLLMIDGRLFARLAPRAAVP